MNEDKDNTTEEHLFSVKILLVPNICKELYESFAGWYPRLTLEASSLCTLFVPKTFSVYSYSDQHEQNR